jgi:hypothetical protein
MTLLLVVSLLVVLYSVLVTKPVCPDGLYSDFSTFWHAGHIALDSSVPNAIIYSDDYFCLYSKYDTTEKPMPFVYSIASAYFFSFLTLFNYMTAKLIMNILNIVFYLAAIIMLLRFFKASHKEYLFGLTVALLFTPFLSNQHWIASDAILLFFIVLGVIFAASRPYLSGVFFGAAALFKIFPIAVALVLGLKNWRISLGCAVTFGIAMLIPGSLDWFSAIGHVSRIYSPIYKYLSDINIYYFLAYACLIVAITAVVSLRAASNADFSLLASFAVPSAFLIMPVVEYHFLTLLILPYLYILFKKTLSWQSAVSAASFLVVFLGLFIDMAMYGVLILWAVLLFYVYSESDNRLKYIIED